MAETNGGEHHSSFAEKLKHPFQELKEKLHNTHLHDAKVHLVHKK
jgi:phospholipase D1/2